MTNADHAAALISQHIPREHRGAIWLRCRKAKTVTRGFLRRAERLERIDRWRAANRRGGQRQHVLTFEPLDCAERVYVTHPEFSRTPDNLKARLLACLDDRERLVIEMRTLGENSLVSTAICLGVTDARICQIERRALAKMLKALRASFPGLEGERA